jgi:hypothetical protein
MTKLSDTQLVILTAACSRDDRRVLPLPASLKGGAANKVVNSLMTKGMVTEVNAERDDLVWRTSEDDRRTTLRVTEAAFAALNLEPHEAATAADDGQEIEAAGVDATPENEAPVGPTEPATPNVRAGTKQAQLIEMLKRPEGATIDDIVAAFGWQPHTARGAIAGALKKKLGLDVTSEKVDGRGRVYRL